MKKAFTLIELLVVIAIIAILAGLMLSTFSGGTESARAARCLTNLKNLANACQTYGMRTGRYPLAGSIEYHEIDTSGGRRNVQMKYYEKTGWISWNSKNAYPPGGATSEKSPALIGMCSPNEDERAHALTNGCIWATVGRNRETFLCPNHIRTKRKSSTPPLWSYLMNAYFGWNTTGKAKSSNHYGIEYGALHRADRLLLFAEVPFAGLGKWFPEGSSGNEDSDAVLQFAIDKSCGSRGLHTKSGTECMGFNHKSGRGYAAHVAFADGHCEKLLAPKTVTESEIRALTTWLCQGVDVSFDGKKFHKMEQ